MKAVPVFNQKSGEYDRWFDEHPVLFESELKALEKVVPEKNIEIRGRFYHWYDR